MLNSENFNKILPTLLIYIKDCLNDSLPEFMDDDETDKRHMFIEHNTKVLHAVRDSLMPKPIIKFDLYKVFLDTWFKTNMDKSKIAGDVVCRSEDLLSDLETYCHKLAWQMTLHNMNRVKYDIVGVKFRPDNEWDCFFKPTDRPIDKMIRDGVPLDVQGPVYSFKHKS